MYRLSRFLPLAMMAIFVPGVRAQWELHTVDPVAELRTPEDAPRAGADAPVLMVAPRGGASSAQVVLLGDALGTARARMTPLKDAAGVELPESVTKIRYGALKELRNRVKTQSKSTDVLGIGELYTNHPYYDALLAEPAEDTEGLLPIWLTVKIPSAAQPGTYKGAVHVGEFSREVVLHVSEWRMPSGPNREVFVGTVQSPETLADTYKVGHWSDEHFALIGRSFEFQAAIGNRTLFVPVLAETHLGNPQGMVLYRPDQEDRWDFSRMDRYLKLYAEKVGEPRPLIFYVWESGQMSRRGRRRAGVSVTIATDDGLREERLPLYGEGAEDVWRQLMDGLHERFTARGWDEDNIVLGAAGDSRPPMDVAEFFRKIAPYARWDIYTHGRGDNAPSEDGVYMLDGMEIGLYEHPYCPGLRYTAGEWLAGGWDSTNKFSVAANPRKFMYLYSPPSQYRSLPDGVTVTTSARGGGRGWRSPDGFTRIGLDAWEMGKLSSYLVNRYHAGNWSNMYRQNPRSILAAGPDGPVATVRYEMLREGLQEAEARIVIEKALVRQRLPEPLATECRTLLAERLESRLREGYFKSSHGAKLKAVDERLWGLPEDWRTSTLKLYELAGKAAPMLQ